MSDEYFEYILSRDPPKWAREQEFEPEQTDLTEIDFDQIAISLWDKLTKLEKLSLLRTDCRLWENKFYKNDPDLQDPEIKKFIEKFCQ